MNKENHDFLKGILKELGFSHDQLLFQQLEEMSTRGVQEFELYTTAIFDDRTKLEAKLYFIKGDQLDIYFFRKYDCLLRFNRRPDKDRIHTFEIHQGTGVSFKEAFNLLLGRSVNKDWTNIDGNKYNAWVQLDLRGSKIGENYRVHEYLSDYGFNLETVIERFPFKEMEYDGAKSAVLNSLRRGNVEVLTHAKGKRKLCIAANPKHKTINVYPAKQSEN
jgi:hypothetical protein